MQAYDFVSLPRIRDPALAPSLPFPKSEALLKQAAANGGTGDLSQTGLAAQVLLQFGQGPGRELQPEILRACGRGLQNLGGGLIVILSRPPRLADRPIRWPPPEMHPRPAAKPIRFAAGG